MFLRTFTYTAQREIEGVKPDGSGGAVGLLIFWARENRKAPTYGGVKASGLFALWLAIGNLQNFT